VKPKKLQQLQSKWYKKLEREGFKDIEDQRGRLKTWSGRSLHDEFKGPLPGYHRPGRDYSSLTWKASQAEYFRLANQYIHDCSFPSEQHKIVWTMHAEGRSYKEIGKVTGLSERNAMYRVIRLRKLFGLSRTK
jgi:DNA-directed RNA polymerase specialized sigma24 family protein